MRLVRNVLLVVLVVAACGNDEKPGPAPVAAAGGSRAAADAFEQRVAELASPATCRLAAAELARLGPSEPRAIPALVAALGNVEATVRGAASAALTSIGESAVGPTAAALDSADEPTRNAAGDALAAMGEPGLRRLVSSLADGSPRVAASASAALVRAGDAAIGPLTQGLTLGSATTAKAAANCLAAMRAASPLVAALGVESTRGVASDALLSMGRSAIPALEAAPDEPRTRTAAKELLARLRTSDLAETVRALGNPATADRASADLAAAGDAATPALVVGLAGESDAVRVACAALLAARAPGCAKDVAPLLADARLEVRATAVSVLIACGDDGAAILLGALRGEGAGVAAALTASKAGRSLLVKALTNDDAPTRAAASRALVAAGADGVPPLEEAAHDRNPGKRAAALGVLGEIGAPALPALGRLVADPDAAVREGAADKLASMGAPAVPTLVATLKSSDAKTQAAASRSLVTIGEPARAALIDATRGVDPGLAARARDVLFRLGGTSVPDLVQLAASPEVDVRVQAVRALGALARTSDAAIAPLSVALDDAEPTVRAEAARGLGLAGPRAKPAGAALDKAMREKVPQVSIEAAAALCRSGAAVSALPFLVNGLRHKDAAIRALAVDAVVRAGLPPAQAGPLLAEALKDREVSVRVAAIRAFVAAGAKGDSVGTAVAGSLKSADPTERAAALAALPAITDTPAAELLHVGGPMRGDRVKREKAKSLGSTPQVEKAVAAALDWFVRHQSVDGRWSSEGFDAQCKLNRCDGPGEKQFDPGVTGLALLSFLGAGETQTTGPHRESVARGLAYLRSIQDATGRIGTGVGAESYLHGFAERMTESDGLLYNHAIATIALCEDFMLTGDPEVGDSARKAVAFVLAAKSPSLGWHDRLPAGDWNDTSMTAWMCWAVATARAAGLHENPAPIRDAASWVEKMTEPEFGRTGYYQKGGGVARANYMVAKFPADKSEGLTAAALMVRLFAGHTPKDDEFFEKGASLIGKKRPRWDVEAGTIDFCYWFWGSMAMRQMDPATWKPWSDVMKVALLDHQRAESDRDELGSWDPIDPWSPQGGRIYSTAMGCMALESYWRMDRLDGGK